MSVKDDAKNLPRAINSILTQTYEDFEFLIMDDASVDNSLEIINTFAKKDRRIKTFWCEF